MSNLSLKIPKKNQQKKGEKKKDVKENVFSRRAIANSGANALRVLLGRD